MAHAFLFDLDDTLYLERDYVRSGFQAVAEYAERQGLARARPTFEELWRLFESGVRNNTFDTLVKSLGLDRDVVPDLVQAYRDHNPRVQLLPGIESMLHVMRSIRPTGIVSDGAVQTQRAKVRALQIESLVDVVVLSDELGREYWKPAPAPFEAALSRCQADAAKSVYVADNPAKDFIGARRLGMTTIRIRHRLGLHEHMEPLNPDYAPDVEVRTIDDLVKALRAL